MQEINAIKISPEMLGTTSVEKSSSLEFRLERGDVVYPSWSLDEFLNPGELQFLCNLNPRGMWSKTIDYHPINGKLNGHNSKDVQSLFGRVSSILLEKIQKLLPKYSGAIRLDRIVLKNSEVATTCGKILERDDLLHLDTLAGAYSEELRLIKLSCNINSKKTRVWEKGPTLADLLLDNRVKANLLLKSKLGRQSFNFNKTSEYIVDKIGVLIRQSDVIQEKMPRKLLVFPAQSSWIAMTDVCLHSTLRGANVLELYFFVRQESLCSIGLSAPSLLDAFFASPIIQSAA